MKTKRSFLFLLAGAALILPHGGTAQTRTVANNSVSLTILGAEYAYEHPLGPKFTLIGRAGLAGGMEWGRGWDGETYFDYAVCPTVGAEARYYHTLDRRRARGRSTVNNSGSFLSMRWRYYFPGGIASDGVQIIGGSVFTPGWGMRRVWGGGWMFEFNTGLNFGPGRFDGDGTTVTPALNIRFGYAF